jgi:hypothetical protein
MKKIAARAIIAFLLAVLIIIQFYRIDKSNPLVNKENDFLFMVQPPSEIASLIKSSCYDCHSNETLYPWYTNIAPVSWIIKSHVTEGREHLNFSEWGNYKPGRRGHILDECKEMVENRKMPLKSYTLLHSSAKLSGANREILKTWLTIE